MIDYFFPSILSPSSEINRGPILPSLSVSHFNIRSAATITSELDKPAALQEFIFDYNFDILTLSETWLSADSTLSTQQPHPSSFSIILLAQLA